MEERSCCQVCRAQRGFAFAVAQHQVNLPVVGGGKHAVCTQIEDGQVGFIRAVKRIVYRAAQMVERADGAVLDGQAADIQPRADERRTDDVQIAGNGIAEARHGKKVVAGNQQRARLAQREGGSVSSSREAMSASIFRMTCDLLSQR